MMRGMATPPRNPFNLGLAEGIRRFGFGKWYERELLSSHAHLLLTLLCCIGLLGTLEAFGGGSRTEKLLGTALFLISGAIGLWALRRYLYLLTHAEDVANQAVCPQCETYARLDVVDEDRRQGHTHVRCRKCAQVWTISS